MLHNNLQLIDHSEYKQHGATISANKGNQQKINSTLRGISMHVCPGRRYTPPTASSVHSCLFEEECDGNQQTNCYKSYLKAIKMHAKHLPQLTFKNQRTSLNKMDEWSL